MITDPFLLHMHSKRLPGTKHASLFTRVTPPPLCHSPLRRATSSIAKHALVYSLSVCPQQGPEVNIYRDLIPTPCID
jgi:hypothetical protein